MSARFTTSLRAPFTSDWRKSHHPVFTAALLAAWRKHRDGWSVDSITLGRRVVLDAEGLALAFARMEELFVGPPKLPAREAAELAAREMAAAPAGEEAILVGEREKARGDGQNLL